MCHFIYQFYPRMIVLVQSSFHTTWASLFEMELEPNSLDWNGNELEHELELEDMKRTMVNVVSLIFHRFLTNNKMSPTLKQLILNPKTFIGRCFFCHEMLCMSVLVLKVLYFSSSIFLIIVPLPLQNNDIFYGQPCTAVKL